MASTAVYSQRYDQPAEIPNNQQYYRLNTEPMKQALEYKQQRYNEMHSKFEALEQRANDLRILGDDSLSAEMDGAIESIYECYKTDLSQTTEAYKLYNYINRFINDCYYRFTRRKQN